jgi:hypothetical protein
MNKGSDMRRAISNLLPLRHRISQYRDVFLFTPNTNKRLHNANKEVLWYRGCDVYKITFRAILTKLDKNIPVLADDSAQISTWSALTPDVKAIVIYLGFHSASTNNNVRITSLIQEYREELESLFDFRFDEFTIRETGRALLSALFNANLQQVATSAIKPSLMVTGHANRTQRRVKLCANNIIFSGGDGNGVSVVSLYQMMQSKQHDQGMFVIQSSYSSGAAIALNQHAYNSRKQFDFYMDDTANLRSNFIGTGAHICKSGGYYYGSASKYHLNHHNESSNQYLLRVISELIEIINKLEPGAKPPLIYLDIGSIRKALTDPALSYSIELLLSTGACVCYIEPQLLKEKHYYDVYLEKYNALHLIGKHADKPVDDYEHIKHMQAKSLKESEFFINTKDGVQCDAGVVTLDFKSLTYQVKARFIRMF